MNLETEESIRAKWRAAISRRLAANRCRTCCRFKVGDDRRFRNCADCRAKDAARQRKRYLKRCELARAKRRSQLKWLLNLALESGGIRRDSDLELAEQLVERIEKALKGC